MFKYLVTSLVSIYAVLTIFGDEARRPEVARQAQDEVTGLTLAAFAMPAPETEIRVPSSGISETEAVQIAMQAGEDYRANRKTSPLRGMVASAAPDTASPSAVSPATAEPAALGSALWYVTGTSVNLRSGPGTGNAVVAKVALGDSAEVLADSDGWYEIRSGETRGWIFGKFLSERKPG